MCLWYIYIFITYIKGSSLISNKLKKTERIQNIAIAPAMFAKQTINISENEKPYLKKAVTELLNKYKITLIQNLVFSICGGIPKPLLRNVCEILLEIYKFNKIWLENHLYDCINCIPYETINPTKKEFIDGFLNRNTKNRRKMIYQFYAANTKCNPAVSNK